MNGYLRQSTASQARAIGPFLDDTDFKTAETALTIANTDIKLRANGTTLSNKNSGGGTHQVNGMYSVTWDATDTANVGELAFSVVVTGALPVWGTYVVLEEVVYDALFAASAAGYGTAQTGDSFARLGAPAGASVSADIAAVKADTAAIKIKTDAMPTDPADASDIAASFATVNTKLDTIDDFLDTEVAAIKAKTDALPTDPADASDIAASFVTVNTKLDTIDDFLDTEVAAIKAKTDNLPADPADASDIAASFTTVNTKLDTIDDLLDTEIAAIKADTAAILADTGTDGVVIAAGSKTGYELSATGVDAILDDVVEGTTTMRQSLRLANSANGGKVAGAATTTVTIRDLADTKARVTATVDADGNRTAVTRDLT